ncbi:MAG: hypothetical protein QF679_02550 [Candidatus Pacebacteria bacterium]|nr:hypothetical protein [Candidatus Paceibacterota bacterium]
MDETDENKKSSEENLEEQSLPPISPLPAQPKKETTTPEPQKEVEKKEAPVSAPSVSQVKKDFSQTPPVSPPASPKENIAPSTPPTPKSVEQKPVTPTQPKETPTPPLPPMPKTSPVPQQPQQKAEPLKPVPPKSFNEKPTAPLPSTPPQPKAPPTSPPKVSKAPSPGDVLANAKARLSAVPAPKDAPPTAPPQDTPLQNEINKITPSTPQKPAGVPKNVKQAADKLSSTPAQKPVQAPAPTQKQAKEPASVTTPQQVPQAASLGDKKISEIGSQQPKKGSGLGQAVVGSIKAVGAGLKGSSLPNLRTFKGDVTDAMKTKKTSLISIAAAEQKAQAKEPPKEVEQPSSSRKMKHVIIAVSAGLLIVIGISVAAFTFLSQAPADDVLVERDVPSIIFVDNTQALDITNRSRREIMNGLTFLKDDVNIQLGLLEQVVLIFRNDFEEVTVVNTEEFLDAIEARVPGSLKRAFESEFTLGIHVFSGNQPFLIFKVKNFRTAFADMLAWEEIMKDDLAPLFGLPLPAFIEGKSEVVATTTPEEGLGTTTPETTSIPGIPQKRAFEDIVIKNQDTRILRDDESEIVLLYTFPDEETVIITTNENTLTEILTRLSSRRIF